MYNVKCDLQTCRKQITVPFDCLKCDKKFCQNNCMIDHTFDNHQQNNNTQAKRLLNFKRRSVMKSPFMKLGQFSKEIIADPLFKFKNFEYVKSGREPQVIGNGVFGDVFLAKNKFNSKFYAIKQMSKLKILENGSKSDIFDREVNVHCRLIHENIVRMYSYHEDEENYYLVKFFK